MQYKTRVTMRGKTFVSYPVEFRSDAIRDAVQLLLGYDGFKDNAKARAHIMTLNPEGRWFTESMLDIAALAKDAKVIASGGTPEGEADMLNKRIWKQMHDWFTRAGSPWRVL